MGATTSDARIERFRDSDEVVDDRLLDEAFGRLLCALEASDLGLITSLWGDFDINLRARMDEEERRITPKLAAIRLRDALAILQERRHLRLRLKEIGASIGQREMGESTARGRMRLESASSFRDELVPHARHEAAILRAL